MIIYQAYCPISNTFYIGQTKNSLDIRKEQHKRSARRMKINSRFHAAIKKYGFDNFQWTILEECVTKKELDILEIKWIALLRECNHRVYNVANGGGGNSCAFWKGKTLTNEAKEKISQSLKDYYKTHTNKRKGKKGKVGWSLGLTKETNESVRRIAESKIGKQMPIHVKEALMAKAKYSRIKSVLCITDGNVFNSITLAAKFYNCSASGISRCCKGEYKTYKGLHFEYHQQPIRQDGS